MGGSKIWILTLGTPGDHEPAAALALSLQGRGHSVKVFGSHRLKLCITKHGIDFEPLDRLLVLHPANAEARAKLREQARDEGMDSEDDYLFDLLMEWVDFSEWLSVKRVSEGKSLQAAADEVQPHAMAMRDFILTGKGVDTLQDTRRFRREFLAEREGISVEDFITTSRKRRQDFKGLMQKVSEGTGLDALDAMQSYRTMFGVHAMARTAVAPGGDEAQRGLFAEIVKGFHSWEEGKQDLDEHWRRWSETFPPFQGMSSVGRGVGENFVLGAENIKLTWDSTPEAERPDLAVVHISQSSAATFLKNACGVRVMLWSTMMPAKTNKEIMDGFNYTVTTETFIEGAPCYTREAGPLSFHDMYHGKRQLLSISPVMLTHHSLCRQRVLNAAATGMWSLDAQESMSDELTSFLDSCKVPPVYFGWGSCPAAIGPRLLSAKLVKAFRALDRPCILAAGFSGIKASVLATAMLEEYGEGDELVAAKRKLLLVDSAPHKLLFPRTACVVHHGGTGTLLTGIAAGVPTVVCPVVLDQFPNADWIQAEGCGIKVAGQMEVKPEDLAAAVEKAIGDVSYKVRAQELAALLAKEKGVARAVELLEGYLSEEPDSKPNADAPLEDGLYAYHMGGNPLPIPPIRLVGQMVLDPIMPVGQMRKGPFTIEDEEGVTAGTYMVQSCFPALGLVKYGSISEDRKTATWSDGTYHQWVSA